LADIQGDVLKDICQINHMKCPCCGNQVRYDQAEQMYICDSCGYKFTIGEDENDLDWLDKNEREYD
jgi:ribosomal protein L37AE/L43A